MILIVFLKLLVNRHFISSLPSRLTPIPKIFTRGHTWTFAIAGEFLVEVKSFARASNYSCKNILKIIYEVKSFNLWRITSMYTNLSYSIAETILLDRYQLKPEEFIENTSPSNLSFYFQEFSSLLRICLRYSRAHQEFIRTCSGSNFFNVRVNIVDRLFRPIMNLVIEPLNQGSVLPN
jgi:hypothetical protein